MVDLPKVPRRIVTSDAPNTSLTRADIASPYATLAQSMADVSGALSAYAEHEAPDAAAKAVVTDAAGNVTVQRTAIPMVGKAGQIYENHIRTGATAAADAQADRDLIDLRAANPEDPQGFLTAATAYRDRKIEHYTPIIGAQGAATLRRQMDTRITQTYGGLQTQHQQKEIARANNAIDALYTSSANELEVLVARDGIGTPDYEQKLGNIRALIEQRVNAPNSTFTREQADLALTQLQGRLETAAMHGAVERALEGPDGINAASRIAERIKSDTSLNLNLQQRQTAYARAQAAINGRVRADTAQINSIAQEMSAIDRIAAEGHTASPARLAALQEAVTQANDPALTAQHEAMKATLPIIAAWRQMSPAQLEGELSTLNRTMREQGANERTLALEKAGQALLGRMRTEIQRDALGWADRVGAVVVPPIDFASPDAGSQMTQRAAIADIVARNYGTPPQYLRPEERGQLETLANSGTVPMQAVAQSIVNGFGPRSTAVLREIGPQAPELAHIGGLLSGGLFGGGSATFANDVAAGAALMRNEETRKQLPRWATTPASATRVFQFENGRRAEQYGAAFDMIPDTGTAAGRAAHTAFVVRSQRRNLDPSAATATPETRDAYNRALQEGAGANFVMENGTERQYGGVISYKTGTFGFRATNHVLVPGTVRADRFRDVIGAIRDEDLRLLPISPTAESGRVYSAADIKAAVPVAVPGGYRFAAGDPNSNDPKWIRGADGQPFVLNFEAVAPALRQRVPGAFIGGSGIGPRASADDSEGPDGANLPRNAMPTQAQDSEGNVIGIRGRMFKNSGETSEQYQERIAPFAADIEGVLQDYEQRLGKARDQWTPAQRHTVDGSREMAAIARRITPARGR